MRSTNRDHVSDDTTESIQRSSVVGLRHQSKMDTTVPSSASFSGAKLVVRLAIAGWCQSEQFHQPHKSGTVTVAGKPSIDIPPGTLNSALKQAGLKK
jgi:predicted RNA binding protein YcfA (HicA-like mRNA interferase family)